MVLVLVEVYGWTHIPSMALELFKLVQETPQELLVALEEVVEWRSIPKFYLLSLEEYKLLQAREVLILHGLVQQALFS